MDLHLHRVHFLVPTCVTSTTPNYVKGAGRSRGTLKWGELGPRPLGRGDGGVPDPLQTRPSRTRLAILALFRAYAERHAVKVYPRTETGEMQITEDEL